MNSQRCSKGKRYKNITSSLYGVYLKPIIICIFTSLCFFSGYTVANNEQTLTLETLKNHYNGHFKVGVAINESILNGNSPKLTDIVTTQFNSITLENAMKADVVNPTRSYYEFTEADNFVEFGLQHKMFIIGHTLVWHNQTPDWFFLQPDNSANSSEQQLDRMKQHIKLVAGRYAGKVDAWDVVNEVIGEDGYYRQTNWVKAVGDGDKLVKYAYQFAAEYAPNTELYYNDFNAWRPNKRDGIIRMVKLLQDEGIRIDGIGIQAHWGLNYPEIEQIEAAIDAYAALGLKVMITELDIDVLPFTKHGQVIGQAFSHPQFQLSEFKAYLDPYRDGLPNSVQVQLTKRYQALFELFYRKKDKIDRVTFWGVHDTMSWKNDYPIPQRTNYPLLWNRDLSYKPALTSILNIPKIQ
ncbi:Endo-1,4-beta-xylanase A precursor [Shewanella sp. P1-14-1]|nr:Endo-1,4-beta-xylanase A precursor [Shewanella sp. P1-14-1]